MEVLTDASKWEVAQLFVLRILWEVVASILCWWAATYHLRLSSVVTVWKMKCRRLFLLQHNTVPVSRRYLNRCSCIYLKGGAGWPWTAVSFQRQIQCWISAAINILKVSKFLLLPWLLAIHWQSCGFFVWVSQPMRGCVDFWMRLYKYRPPHDLLWTAIN